MSQTLEVKKIGDSYGILLSEDILHDLNIREGDFLYPIITPDGIQLLPYDPDFAVVMESTRDYMRRHRNAMYELAQ